MKFTRSDPNSVFDIHYAMGIQLLARLYLGLGHLNDHNLRNNFEDCINPVCNYVHDIETTAQFFIHRPHSTYARRTLFNKINNLDSIILERHESFIRDVLLVDVLLCSSKT